MPISEKGYKPYTGKRLPSRRNHLVIAAMEARRAGKSWVIWVVVALSVLTTIVVLGYALAASYFAGIEAEMFATAGREVDMGEQLGEILDPELVLTAMNIQLAFVVLLTLGWGAGAIASDASSRALQFYFAKPVIVKTYLLGKIIPLALVSSIVLLIPGVLMAVVEAILLREYGHVWSRLALILPSILYAAVGGAVIGTTAVAVSSMSRSRGFTLILWGAVLFVPIAVAWIASFASDGEFQWPYLASILDMVMIIGRAIFRLEIEGDVTWYHSVLMLALLLVGSAWLMRYRLSRPEVVG